MNEKSTPSLPNVSALVLYDDTCLLCRTLAGFVQKRARAAFIVMPWRDYASSRGIPLQVPPPKNDSLRVLLGDRMLEGTAAWDYLLENYRDMEGLNWIAQKLGLRQATAVVLERTGHALRRVLCRRCTR